MPQQGSLSEKVALVTGGASGIGASIAKRLASDGISTVINYRSQEEQATALVQQICESGGVAAAVQADLKHTSEVDSLVDQVVNMYGGLDILVVCAGIVGRGAVQDITDDDWSNTIEINLAGAFRSIRSAVPHLIERGGGSIVTVSSDAGKFGGRATGVHYAASKGGMIAMTMTLARQLAPFSIRVNDVAPAEIQTGMLASLSEEHLSKVRKKLPLGRLGRPEDVSEAVAYLASDSASFITGISLDVDGGLHLSR
jgi:NAD(P)-dependent dehydrogenase (short-subunit alcohol dehydrogenase family)